MSELTLQSTQSTFLTGPLLGVWAHPDDEAYLSAGLMALARRAGARVVVATATAGEQGASDRPRSRRALARLRRRELHRSLAAVDVHEHTFLGYRDGSCQQVPPAQPIAALRELMEQVRPAATVTFGPDGLTGHPDHQAVSAWTTAAWHAAGSPGQLLYATLTPEFHQTWGALNQELGVWMDASCVPSTPKNELALALELDPQLLALKYAALRAQASQTASLIERLGPATYQRWFAAESFVAASGSR